MKGITLGDDFEGERDGDKTGSCSACQLTLKLLVNIAIEGETGMQRGWHLMGEEAIALCFIDSETYQLALLIEITETITIGKGCCASYHQRAVADALHLTYGSPYRLRSIEGEDICLVAIKQIWGKSSVKRLIELGGEGVVDLAERGTAVIAGMGSDEMVYLLSVGSGDILDILLIFQSALYLKRGDASLYHAWQMGDAVHILQRK